MTKKTALQEFLEQIVLKQVKDSVYLLPAVTDIQIKEALKKEIEQIKDAYGDGINAHRNDFCNRDEYFVKEGFNRTCQICDKEQTLKKPKKHHPSKYIWTDSNGT